MIASKRIKLIASNVMLLTGIVTSVCGAVEAIINLFAKFNPLPTKSLQYVTPDKSIPETTQSAIDTITNCFSLTPNVSTVLLIIGLVIVALSIYSIKRLRRPINST